MRTLALTRARSAIPTVHAQPIDSGSANWITARVRLATLRCTCWAGLERARGNNRNHVAVELFVLVLFDLCLLEVAT